MIQLVLTILAIALFAAMLGATMNYAPWWYKAANEANEQFTKSFRVLESAYDLTVRANEGQAPPVTAASDGGFSEGFLPVLRFSPALPPRFTITYGKNESEGSNLSGLNWFCVHTPNINEGAWRGLMRTKALYSQDQMFVNTSCGASTNMSMPASGPEGPVAVTLYVAYTPGLSE